MTVVQDVAVGAAAETLLACLTTEVDKTPNPPKVKCLRHGVGVDLMLSTRDDECCEGLAWVRVVSVYPSSSFPEADTAYVKCGPMQYAAVLEMGVARCLPVPSANEIITCAEWTAVSVAALDDAAAMRRAVCCYTTATRFQPYLVGAWGALPSDGGCFGGTQTVTVAIPACDC